MVRTLRLWLAPIALLCAQSHAASLAQEARQAGAARGEASEERQIDLLRSNAMTALEWSTLQLTHPGLGVYSSGNVVFGGQPKRVTKDEVARSLLANGTPDPPPTFNTDPRNMSPVFGSLMAIRLFALWREAAQPDPDRPFYLIELGGGTGRLAHDILTFVRDGPHREETSSEWKRFYERLRYLGIDISSQYVRQQNQVNSRFVAEGRFRAVRGDASTLPEHPFFRLSDAERDLLFTTEARGELAVDSDTGELNPVVGIFLSNEFPDILPFHLIRIHRERAKADELVAFVPILPQETYARIEALLRHLASQDQLVATVDQETTRLTSDRLEQILTEARAVGQSLGEVCQASRSCLRAPLPIDVPALASDPVYLGKRPFSILLSALSESRDAIADPERARESLPAARLPSHAFIMAAAEKAGLDLAEEVLLELIWHVGFQPVVLPLESASAELPELRDPLLARQLATMRALLVEESLVFFWPSAQISWIEGASRVLASGYVVTVDYWADLRHWYYGVGPVQRYFTETGRQQVAWDPEEVIAREPWHYLRFGLGFYDVTTGAHFAALARAGSRAGLELAAYDSQEQFLARSGDAAILSEMLHYYRSYLPAPDSGDEPPYPNVHMPGGSAPQWRHEWRLFGQFLANPAAEASGSSGRYALVQRKREKSSNATASEPIVVNRRTFATEEEALSYLDYEWDRSVARRIAEPDPQRIRLNLEKLEGLRGRP